MSEAVLKIENLRTYYYTYRGVVKAVDGVDLTLNEGEVCGLVGESGCGKSTLGLSILKLISNPGKIVGGRILFNEKDILSMNHDDLRKIRGREISMIFQDPNASLNPVFTIGNQVAEAIIAHETLKQHTLKERTLDILRKVRIPHPEERFHSFPHEFSGGMRQRAMIAMALACSPKLIIADEPTTNLDVTIEAQFLELIKELKNEYGSSIMLITHNLGVIAEMADKIGIMYAGKIVEYSDAITIFKRPKHPYTSALLRLAPRPDKKLEKLMPIPGSIPNMIDIPSGCRFHPRCEYAKDICHKQDPELVEIEKGHSLACFNLDKMK